MAPSAWHRGSQRVADKPRVGLPREVWALGFVSLFMDTSSELVHSVLPVFMATTLGASKALIGLIEGVAEAIAQVLKLFAGVSSDWSRRRKPFVLAGYGLSALTKPLFPLADTIWLVALARFSDRIGKGIRGSPRDALLADVTPPEMRGAAYGLRQSLDTVGAILGPLAAAGLLIVLAGDLRTTLWFAVLPAILCVLTIVFLVREPEQPAPSAVAAQEARPSLAGLGRLGAGAWFATVVAGVLTLARFSEAFLLLRGETLGLGTAAIPFVLVLMNAAYTLSSYPAGVVSDHVGRRGILLAGIATLVLADLALAAGGEGLVVFGAGIGLWGLHMGLTQGLLAAMVADAAPAELRGTAFGVFNLVSGIALLVASTVAGLLWDAIGPQAPFLGGALVASAGLGLLALAPQGRRG
jgi:MFS family permease